jgi:hypothetical protein
MSKEKVQPINQRHTFKVNDLDLANKHILDFHVFVPSGVSVEDILEPSAWTHIAQRLQPMCHIYVTAEDNSFCALLRVLSCGQLWAKTAVIWHKDLSESIRSGSPKGGSVLEVQYVSNRYKWGVKRIADGKWVSMDHVTEADAQQAMANELLEMQVG